MVLTHVWLDASVCPAVNVQVSLLGEPLMTVGAVTAVSLSSCLIVHRNQCSLAFHACLGNRGHPRSEWLLGSISLHVCLALNGLHQLVHLCLKVDMITRVECFVGGDSF
jgi:hypothetical protein